MNKALLACLALVGASGCGASSTAKAPAADEPPAARAQQASIDSTPAAAAAPGAPAPAAPSASIPQVDDRALDRSVTARTMGVASAPVTIYELSDFQCPFCREFVENTLPAVKREFVNTGRVRIIFVNLPLVQLHPNALAAHEFAMCAADQGKFWPVHDLLYRHQDSWAKLADPKPYLFALGDSARLGRDALRTCLTTGAVRGLLLADLQTAARNGIRSTPSFIINGALLPGAAPMNLLRPILDSIYRAATSK